jgi:hypothetical protein
MARSVPEPSGIIGAHDRGEVNPDFFKSPTVEKQAVEGLATNGGSAHVR